MPYSPGNFDTEHVYLQWGGKLVGGEQWSNGLRLAPIGGVSLVNDATWLAAAKTAIQTFHTAAAAAVSNTCKLSFVKGNVIKADGHYKFDTNNEIAVADVAGASSGGSFHPPQVTVAITTLTGFSRGPAHKGRFYLPQPNFVLGTDGLLQVTDCTNLKTAATTLINSINAASSNVQLAVFSRKSGSAAHRLITGVSVGRVMDTQRRRRRSLVEAYN
jgi:hypothetical protein